jgi:methylisocitrate lyase
MSAPQPNSTPGSAFRAAVTAEHPLQIVGAVNALHARMAQRVGYLALYLSGGGVAASSLGVPDLGITTLDDVLTDVRRITDVTTLPLLVDIDTGFGGAFNIARTIRSLIKAGAAGCHIEDQVAAKRCGHRPNKQIVPTAEMLDRIKAAVDARTDPSFVIMARTDALASEGLEAALARAVACVEAGAERTRAPILANITEFGSTPLFTLEELRSANVSLALYPLSAFRAMNAAALNVYEHIRSDGTQKNVLPTMQTREELYDLLDYHAYERKLDELFAKESKA